MDFFTYYHQHCAIHNSQNFVSLELIQTTQVKVKKVLKVGVKEEGVTMGYALPPPNSMKNLLPPGKETSHLFVTLLNCGKVLFNLLNHTQKLGGILENVVLYRLLNIVL